MKTLTDTEMQDVTGGNLAGIIGGLAVLDFLYNLFTSGGDWQGAATQTGNDIGTVLQAIKQIMSANKL